jgi:RNA polymerase sigma factor (TIGR02999 family)
VSDVTQLLEAMHRGDSGAAGALLSRVYAELRELARAKMSGERPDHTLQPTALVHEAWLKLAGDAAASPEQRFASRGHFFGAAAEAMRRILVDSARRKLRQKRGAGAEHLDIESLEISTPTAESELLDIHESLDRLAAEDPQKAELVKLRFFVGLSLTEAAELLGISERTAKRHWAYARAWLYDAIQRARQN